MRNSSNDAFRYIVPVLNQFKYRHTLTVLNQFKYDGDRGRRACVPICLMALYHVAEEIRDCHNYKCPTILNQVQWSLIMERGIRMWQVWKENHRVTSDLFPKIEEILALPQCVGFYQIFKKEEDIDERERSGLVIPSSVIENPLGSLYTLCLSMIEKKQNVYTILILPVCFSAVAMWSRKHLNGYSFFLFDPHGAAGSDDVTLIEFDDYRDVVRYLVTRYNIECIDTYVPSQYAHYDETKLYEMYSYSASLFTIK